MMIIIIIITLIIIIIILMMIKCLIFILPRALLYFSTLSFNNHLISPAVAWIFMCFRTSWNGKKEQKRKVTFKQYFQTMIDFLNNFYFCQTFFLFLVQYNLCVHDIFVLLEYDVIMFYNFRKNLSPLGDTAERIFIYNLEK